MEHTTDLKVHASNPSIHPSPDTLIYISPLSPTKTIRARNFFPSAFSYILAYLEIGYFFCFIPFRIRLNVNTEQYEIKEFLPQKLLTVIFHIFQTTYSGIWYMKLLIKYHYSDEPLKFFRISESLIDFLYLLIFTHFMILTKDSFKLFFQLGQKYHICTGASSSKKYWMGLCICFASTIFGLLSNTLTSVTAPMIDIGSLFGNNILRLLLSLWHSFGEGTSVLLFAFGWYLRQICEDLGTKILSEENTWSDILKQYLHMKQINASINSITKYMILVYIVGYIPFLSQGITDLSLAEPKNVLSFVSAGIGFLISMLGSAEANSKANQLKHTLLERQLLNFGKETDVVSLQMLLSEFSAPEIGLQGMHFFTVTYGLLGVMLAQCLVYALIILQLKAPASSN